MIKNIMFFHIQKLDKIIIGIHFTERIDLINALIVDFRLLH